MNFILWRCIIYCIFFFFKQKTAYEMRISDWSSDVCSSDLGWTKQTLDETDKKKTRDHDDDIGDFCRPAAAGRMWEYGGGHSRSLVGGGARPGGGRGRRSGGDAAGRGGGSRSDGRRVGEEVVRKCRSRGAAVN